MIVIVSFKDNPHVEAVTRYLSEPFVVVDQAWFPSRMSTRVSVDRERGMNVCMTPVGSDSIDFQQVGAVWNRRVRTPEIAEEITDPDARLFAWSESHEAMQGILHSTQCFWMNPILSDEASQRKVRQLQVARQVGLAVPRTLITNEPREARRFIVELGERGAIRKPFRCLPNAAHLTRRVTTGDLGQLESVQWAPVIFQEFVEGSHDLRVTVVGDELFCAAYEIGGGFEEDYRPGIGKLRSFEWNIPSEVEDGLRMLMSELGLQYGAVDLRVRPDGEHVFFEVNPGGEFLFVTQGLGLPVDRAIAALLSRNAYPS